jgi:DNA-binding NarL/FixJ family response regulator
VIDGVRVLVVDDHPLFRQGVAALVRDAPGLELAAEAVDGEEALRLAAELRPDVVVMDVSMPGLGGVEATRQLVRDHPDVAVLMLTMVDDDDAVFAAMRAGARGYVLKGAEPDQIRRAVQTVAGGEAVFGGAIARRLMEYFSGAGPQPLEPFSELTPREREILELVSAGASNAIIAARLQLSEKTVRNNVSNIFTKLRVTDRAAAVARARDAGIGPRGNAG